MCCNRSRSASSTKGLRSCSVRLRHFFPASDAGSARTSGHPWTRGGGGSPFPTLGCRPSETSPACCASSAVRRPRQRGGVFRKTTCRGLDAGARRKALVPLQEPRQGDAATRRRRRRKRPYHAAVGSPWMEGLGASRGVCRRSVRPEGGLPPRRPPLVFRRRYLWAPAGRAVTVLAATTETSQPPTSPLLRV